MKQQSVTVLGMHRSGTSLVAGVLKQLGVDMGEHNPPIVKWDSPLGQIEDLDFVKLDNKILVAAGGSWDKPPSHEAIMQQKDKFDGEIKSLIDSIKSPIWGWKTARNCLTVDLYLPHLPEPLFVVCRRDADMISQSLATRNGMDSVEAFNLISTYEARINDFLGRCIADDCVYEFQYEKVSRFKADFVDGLTDFIGLRVNSDMRNRAIDVILPHRAVRELSDNMRAMDDIKLDVGCGKAKHEGWIGMDICPFEGVDIVWDIEHFPWPLANECCSEILMDQVFGLIEPRYRLAVMNELWRIAKPECQVNIRVPHAGSTAAGQDPEVYTCPNQVTFWYFDRRHPRYEEYNPLPWYVVKQFIDWSDQINVTLLPCKEELK